MSPFFLSFINCFCTFYFFLLLSFFGKASFSVCRSNSFFSYFSNFFYFSYLFFIFIITWILFYYFNSVFLIFYVFFLGFSFFLSLLRSSFFYLSLISVSSHPSFPPFLISLFSPPFSLFSFFLSLFLCRVFLRWEVGHLHEVKEGHSGR